MLNLTLISMILIPVLVYWLSRKPTLQDDVLRDYVVPAETDMQSVSTHWGVPAGVSRVNRALLREVVCHPKYIEHSVPPMWFKWSPADAKRRARQRATQVAARQAVSGVLSIRKQA